MGIDKIKMFLYNDSTKSKKECLVMKKFLIRLATCVLTLLCVLGIAGCSSPELDFSKARANLEAKGYIVTVKTGEDCDVGIEEQLYAMKGEEYIRITHYKTNALAKAYYARVEAEYEASIEMYEAEIEYYEVLLDNHRDEISSDEIADAEDEIKDLKEELEELKSNMENVGRSGKYVWYGTKFAIEDSKN